MRDTKIGEKVFAGGVIENIKAYLPPEYEDRRKSDLILLIGTEDELYGMDKALVQLTGQGHGNGIYSKLDNVYKVIQNNSHPSYFGSEEAGEKFHEIISNFNKTPEERAEILRNGIF